jgi:type III pantothenate kinase
LAAPAPLLAIDAGNTRIKWGVIEAWGWSTKGAIATAEAAKLVEAWKAFPEGIRAIASNVAGVEVQRHLEHACQSLGSTLEVVAPAPIALGVTNGYRDPRQLGADRWAALIAAHHGQRGHKLVVNAGTALTVDALLDDGQFLGGLIVPGPSLMRRSLDSGTAGLRWSEGRFDAFPVRTQDAIFSGAIQACVGAIERMRAAMAAGQCPPERVILSGGAAGEITPHLSLPHGVNENLVLDGLALIARNA